MILNAQVPITVPTAGHRACPLPRITPAGISYKLHIGSNSRMYMIRSAALSTTARSGVNSPEKKSRNMTIVKIKTELQTLDSNRQSHRIFLHLSFCPAA